MNADLPLFLAVNDFARSTPWLHGVVFAYATYGVVLFAALLVAGWWVARRLADPAVMAAALWAPVGMLVAVGINQPIVGLVHEARPYTALPHILVLAQRSTDPSFPSDHSMMAGAVAAGLFLVSRRLGVVSLVAALVMAFARVYIAAHYPHDVVVGLLLGAAISLAGYALLRGVLRRLVLAAESTRLRPLMTSVPGERRAVAG